MNKSDQNIFLQEMAGNSQWKTVDVAIKLARSERVKEAMEIMLGFPTEDRVRFFDEVPSLMDQFLSEYGGRVIRI